MDAVFALPDDPGPTIVSHMAPIINRADFAAIKVFESLHPELYKEAKRAPTDASHIVQMKAQIDERQSLRKAKLSHSMCSLQELIHTS
jgi:hypothetical protein